MLVTGIGSKKNMLQLEDVTGKSWYKINESNEEHQKIVDELKIGDTVSVQYSTINGVKNINELKKTVETPIPVTNNTKNTLKVGNVNNFNSNNVETFKCKTCGKVMPNGNYENCYDCNMKNKSTKSYGKTPAEQNHIARQAIGHMTSVTVAALIKTIPEITEEKVIALINNLYDTYKTKVLG